MDKGPWRVFPDEMGTPIYVSSDDFAHDVQLRVFGDFADDAERLAYCEWLAGVLNSASRDYLANSLAKEYSDNGSGSPP
jgi:hypothetical protein